MFLDCKWRVHTDLAVLDYERALGHANWTEQGLLVSTACLLVNLELHILEELVKVRNHLQRTLNRGSGLRDRQQRRLRYFQLLFKRCLHGQVGLIPRQHKL